MEDEAITPEQEERFHAAVAELDAAVTRVETGVNGLREGVDTLFRQTTELNRMLETHLALFANDRKRRQQNTSDKLAQTV